MAEFMAQEMAELLERGLEFRQDRDFRVQEKPWSFLQRIDSVYYASALGMALIGRYGDPAAALADWLEVSNQTRTGKLEAAAHLLGISVALATLIEVNHESGVAARAIAQHLRAGTLGLAMGSRPAPVTISPRRSIILERVRTRIVYASSSPDRPGCAAAGAEPHCDACHVGHR